MLLKISKKCRLSGAESEKHYLSGRVGYMYTVSKHIINKNASAKLFQLTAVKNLALISKVTELTSSLLGYNATF